VLPADGRLGDPQVVAIVNLTQTTDAAITTTSATPTTAASLNLVAAQTGTVTATSNAGKGGAQNNDKQPNDNSRAKGQAKTDDEGAADSGSLTVAGALSVGILTTTTTGRIVAAKVSTTGAQKVSATGKNTVTSLADGGTTEGAGGNGVGVGIAVNIIDLTTHAFVSGVGLIAGAAGVSVEALARRLRTRSRMTGWSSTLSKCVGCAQLMPK